MIFFSLPFADTLEMCMEGIFLSQCAFGVFRVGILLFSMMEGQRMQRWYWIRLLLNRGQKCETRQKETEKKNSRLKNITEIKVWSAVLKSGRHTDFSPLPRSHKVYGPFMVARPPLYFVWMELLPGNYRILRGVFPCGRKPSSHISQHVEGIQTGGFRFMGIPYDLLKVRSD